MRQLYCRVEKLQQKCRRRQNPPARSFESDTFFRSNFEFRCARRFLTPLTNAIVAFWNAPLDDPQQEINACEAALEMLARADKLNQEFKREADQNGAKYMPLRVGIGLNTGPCVVGNMGSHFRFNYSVLGDTVNVASRLEARTKD
jgi:adenylate cyclase